MYSKLGSDVKLVNCVVFANGGSKTFYRNFDKSLTVNTSLLENTIPTGMFTGGTGNLLTASSPFASSTDLQLIPGSAAVNAGDNQAYAAVNGPVTDLAGNTRILNSIIDMGAFESYLQPCGSPAATLGQALRLTEPRYDCQTGSVRFLTEGGDGSPITYSAVGITSPITTCTALVDAQAAADIRSQKPNIAPFTLYASQGNVTVSYSWNALGACAGSSPSGSPQVVNPVTPQSAAAGMPFSLDLANVFANPNQQPQLATRNQTSRVAEPTFTYSAQGLPAGLSLNGSVISGTPTTPGVSQVTVTATNASGLSTSLIFVITIDGPNPPTGGALSATVVSYDCQTGAITFGATGGNGSAVEYLAIGVTGWTTNANQTIEVGLRADPKPITVRVRQNGIEGQSFEFDFATYCTNPPSTTTTTPPSSTTSTPPTGGALAATVVSYDCPSGAIVLGATGGNGSVVEYMAIGITGWTANPNQVIEAGLRADPKPITVQVRQGGVEGTSFTFIFQSYCAVARVGREGVAELDVRALGNPVLTEQLEVEVSGVSGEPLTLEVLSGQGSRVSVEQVVPTRDTVRHRVGLGHQAGVYLLRVSTPSRSKTIKVIRQ